MSRDLDQDTLNNLEGSLIRPFYAIELNFDNNQTVRMWTGRGTLTMPDSTEWVGLGKVLGISSLEETSELAVKGATLTLSGVPQDLISLALSEPYQGRVCNIYFGTFNSGSNTTDYFNMMFSGYMDQMNIEETPDVSTIELNVENKLIDLERPRVARFSSGYQKSIYPNDLGLDFVESLQDKTVLWGRSK